MGHRVLDHTADTGVEAIAPSLVELIAELAGGMFALMAEPGPTRAGEWVEARVVAETAEDLVVESLSELLYRFESEDRVPSEIEVSGSGELAVVIRARTVPLAEVEVVGPPIKAVTYHGLVVERREDGWYGRVYFDV